MDLKQEIHQKKFRSQRLKGIVNLVFTYNWLKSHLQAHLKKFGITMQQFNVLRILNGQHPNPTTIALIKERMLDKMSDASRIVNRLERKKLVRREPSTTDLRTIDIFITEKGKNLIVETDKHSHEMDKIFSALSAKELKELNFLLDKVRDIKL
ncbi:MAG: MarR family winged helix-turn-helix transcriptional regulator [Chitinophagales bacterium]